MKLFTVFIVAGIISAIIPSHWSVGRKLLGDYPLGYSNMKNKGLRNILHDMAKLRKQYSLIEELNNFFKNVEGKNFFEDVSDILTLKQKTYVEKEGFIPEYLFEVYLMQRKINIWGRVTKVVNENAEDRAKRYENAYKVYKTCIGNFIEREDREHGGVKSPHIRISTRGTDLITFWGFCREVHSKHKWFWSMIGIPVGSILTILAQLVS